MNFLELLLKKYHDTFHVRFEIHYFNMTWKKGNKIELILQFGSVLNRIIRKRALMVTIRTQPNVNTQ